MDLKTVADFTFSLLFHLFIVAQLPQQIFGASCPSVCWCDRNNVNCNEKNLTYIPNNLPKDTVYLNMDNNRLRVLDLELLSSLPKLEYLTLRDNLIANVKASKFKKLTKLKSVDLHGNCLRILKNGPFSSMPGLIHLDLSKNSLTSVEGTLKNLSHLTVLSLSDNSLTSFSNNVFVDTLHLEELDIKKNKVKKLNLNAFGHLKRLSLLELTQNDIQEITGSWQKCSHLQMLDLSQCQLADIPSNLPPSLKYLNIGSNRLTSITKNSFENYHQLEFLVLDHNLISSIESLSFLSLKKLRDLDLSDNLISLLPKFWPKSLRDINLDRNNISALTFNSFSRLTYLTSLSLRNNSITKLNQKAFGSLRSLKFLYMDENPLTVIAEDDLAHQRGLEVLSLNSCPLERIEFRPFIKLKALKELHLAFINNANLSFNVAALEELSHLEKLNLQGSPFLISRLIASEILKSLQNKLKELNIMNGYLTYLPTNFKVFLRNTPRIKLAGNPFHCDANIRWLHNWIINEPDKFPHKDLITCMTPQNVQGISLQSLTETHFISSVVSSNSSFPDGFFSYTKMPAPIEISPEIIQDLDYTDDFINYPISGPERDEKCLSENIEEPHTNANIKTEIFKYTSSVNSVVIDVTWPRERTRFEKTSTLCADCDSDINVTDNRLEEILQESSTTQINERKREEILDDDDNYKESSDSIASVTANNNRISKQVIWEGLNGAKVWPDENNLLRSNSNNKISTGVVTITPFIHAGRLNDAKQNASNQSGVKSFAGKDSGETKFPTTLNSKTAFERDNLSTGEKNNANDDKNRIDDVVRESGIIPNIVERKTEPPHYLKEAAIIASTGAGLLTLSTSLLLFLIRRFHKKKEREVTSEYPLENC